MKIGHSKNVHSRRKSVGTKPFGFPDGYNLWHSFPIDLKTAKTTENIIKEEFFEFRDKRFRKNTEVFQIEALNRLLFALKESTRSPKQAREIAWRAANLSLNPHEKARVERFNSKKSMNHRYLSHSISDIFRERFPKLRIFSERLDSGLALNISVLETPHNIFITYCFEMSMTEANACHQNVYPPEWRAKWVLGERHAQLIVYEEDIFDNDFPGDEFYLFRGSFTVKFTDVFSKRSSRRRSMVSKSCGQSLGKALRDELLAARFTEYSRLDMNAEELRKVK